MQNIHLGDWVRECDQKKIKISGGKAQGLTADFWEQNSGSGRSSVTILGPCLQFSKKLFMNVLMEFIVSDDQVSTHESNIITTLIFVTTGIEYTQKHGISLTPPTPTCGNSGL